MIAGEEATAAVSWRDHGVWGQPALARLLDCKLKVVLPGCPIPASVHAAIGWGRRPSGERAARLAREHGLDCWRLEDGFLRSVGLGHSSPPLSIVIDDLGIYYDSSTPSRLERQISSPRSEVQHERARRLIESWRLARVSKYNQSRDAPLPVPVPYVLVVDQTAGDLSIRTGAANASSFHRMLRAALDENPRLPIVLKVHPDVVSGRKRGHFDLPSTARIPRVTVISDDVHAASLLERARAVYTVTSQMGFEALIWGKTVRTFGMPFYAGWGLTKDDSPAPERRRTGHRVTLEDLVHAALVEYSRYLDPETGARCEPERLIEWMSLQRRMRERFPAQIQGLGFSRRKRPIVQSFLAGTDIRFVGSGRRTPTGQVVATWGVGSADLPGGGEGYAQVLRVEDGFLRSVGLGADLVRPISWVIDDMGIHYDATRPSRLETILRETEFDAPMLERARALRKRIIAEGFTKYNVGSTHWHRPSSAVSVVLVAGQVEGDASLRFGAPGLRTNGQLLRAAREARPDAWIVYKPHPDVVAGLRPGGSDESHARRWCDEIVTDAPMHALLDAVDEVHVLTSLTGFEALLRDKPVVAYGCPFYAGWGLTADVAEAPAVWARRGRRLSVDELTAGALILYPTYVSLQTKAFTTPERALDELSSLRRTGAVTTPHWRRAIRPLLRLFAHRPVAQARRL